MLTVTPYLIIPYSTGIKRTDKYTFDTYHDSNSSWELKISGKRKFRSDHSSAKLFCSGVPVRRSLFSMGMCFSSFRSLHFVFFSRCPCIRNMIIQSYKQKEHVSKAVVLVCKENHELIRIVDH